MQLCCHNFAGTIINWRRGGGAALMQSAATLLQNWKLKLNKFFIFFIYNPEHLTMLRNRLKRQWHMSSSLPTKEVILTSSLKMSRKLQPKEENGCIASAAWFMHVALCHFVQCYHGKGRKRHLFGAMLRAARLSLHDLYLDANSQSLKGIHQLISKLLGGPNLIHPFVPCSWGSWLMIIIAVGHLHFRPIFHPIYFSLSKERHFDVPQISLWLLLRAGKGRFPLVLQWRRGNERG